MRNVVVVGAGGLGVELALAIDALSEEGGYSLAGFVDDVAPRAEQSAIRDRYLGPVAGASIPDEHEVVLGVGDPRTRYLLTKRLGPELEYATIVHPTAVVAPSATVAAGTFIAPFAYVGPGASIGMHCVLNVYASVGHDAVIGSNTVLSPYATLNGGAESGEGTFLGTRASVGVGLSVGAWSKVSAGTFVTKTCAAGSLVAGNPPKGRVLFKPPDHEV